MQPTPQDTNQKIELQLRTMRVLWLALMISIGMYFVLTIFTGSPKDPHPNNVLSLTFVGIAMLATLASIFVKQKLLSRSVGQQNFMMVQQAYIVAWAVCEAGALMGLMDFFLTGNKFYYAPFVIAIIGDLINSPRRSDLEAAFFK